MWLRQANISNYESAVCKKHGLIKWKVYTEQKQDYSQTPLFIMSTKLAEAERFLDVHAVTAVFRAQLFNDLIKLLMDNGVTCSLL